MSPSRVVLNKVSTSFVSSVARNYFWQPRWRTFVSLARRASLALRACTSVLMRLVWRMKFRPVSWTCPVEATSTNTRIDVFRNAAWPHVAAWERTDPPIRQEVKRFHRCCHKRKAPWHARRPRHVRPESFEVSRMLMAPFAKFCPPARFLPTTKN